MSEQQLAQRHDQHIRCRSDWHENASPTAPCVCVQSNLSGNASPQRQRHCPKCRRRPGRQALKRLTGSTRRGGLLCEAFRTASVNARGGLDFRPMTLGRRVLQEAGEQPRRAHAAKCAHGRTDLVALNAATCGVAVGRRTRISLTLTRATPAAPGASIERKCAGLSLKIRIAEGAALAICVPRRRRAQTG